MSRCDSAAIVPNTSELLPEPETPVKTVSRRFGISTLTSLRLFSRAPCTRIRSWLSGPCGARGFGLVLVDVLVVALLVAALLVVALLIVALLIVSPSVRGAAFADVLGVCSTRDGVGVHRSCGSPDDLEAKIQEPLRITPMSMRKH